MSDECFICYETFTNSNREIPMPCLCKNSFRIHTICLAKVIDNNGVTCKTCNKSLIIFNDDNGNYYDDEDEETLNEILNDIQSPNFEYTNTTNLSNLLNIHHIITSAYINKYPEAFEYVEDKTPEICKEAVQLDGMLLKYIPEEKQTYELCIDAVKSNGFALQFSKFKNAQICLEAVKSNGAAISIIPDFNPQEWYGKLLDDGTTISYNQLALIAVKQDPFNIKYIQSPTVGMCLRAVRKNGLTFQFIKNECKSFELAVEAIKTIEKDLKDNKINYYQTEGRSEYIAVLNQIKSNYDYISDN
jgi:hypothetical protein